jgi:hypothetical protein
MIYKLNIESRKFIKTLNESVSYSQGFFEGVQMNRLKFNQELGLISEEMLKKYIDSRSKMDKESMHHVYEWGMVGSPEGRLFEIKSKASKNNILFFGNFLPSKSISDSSKEPFVDKAEIMENSIMIKVSPTKSDFLAFEGDDGEMVFTTETIYIENPGGDAVAGSFGKIVGEFFDSHFTSQILSQTGILNRLQNPVEFSQNFGSVKNGNGRSAGIASGKKYLTVKGVEF